MTVMAMAGSEGGWVNGLSQLQTVTAGSRQLLACLRAPHQQLLVLPCCLLPSLTRHRLWEYSPLACSCGCRRHIAACGCDSVLFCGELVDGVPGKCGPCKMEALAARLRVKGGLFRFAARLTRVTSRAAACWPGEWCID